MRQMMQQMSIIAGHTATTNKVVIKPLDYMRQLLHNCSTEGILWLLTKAHVNKKWVPFDKLCP